MQGHLRNLKMEVDMSIDKIVKNNENMSTIRYGVLANHSVCVAAYLTLRIIVLGIIHLLTKGPVMHHDRIMAMKLSCNNYVLIMEKVHGANFRREFINPNVRNCRSETGEQCSSRQSFVNK
jgi:hypothetical protein